MAKFPTIKELSALVRAVKSDSCDEYRAFEGDDEPGIRLIVGSDPKSGDWSWQTGDSSYTGGAYRYPNWAVVRVYRRSNLRKVARDIQSRLADL